MKALYYLRVFFVSYEFLTLLATFGLYAIWSDEILSVFQGVRTSDDALKWLVAYPIGLAGWMLKDGVGVLFPDEKSNRILHEWPEYWRLKAHFDVGLFYSISLTVPCVLVWVFDKLKTIEGAWVFGACAVALSVSAYSFYEAKIKLKSTLIHLNEEQNSNKGVN
jgi:hypothetical protein